MPYKKILSIVLLTFFTPLVVYPAVDASIDKQLDINEAARKSQITVDELDDQASRDLQRYRVKLQRRDSLAIYTQQLQKLIASQEAEITSIKRQTNEIEAIETGSLPLMIQMTQALDEIVGADVPFLREERLERIENLRFLIDRADVTAGEKFRRIMEAYLIEVDYGKTIEAYRGELLRNNVVRTVDFLRIGRIGLFYQTLDGSESGRWDPEKTGWETLSSNLRREIQLGLRIARKQAPPELLTLPILKRNPS